MSSALHTPKSFSAGPLSFPGPSPPPFSVTTLACVLWKRPNLLPKTSLLLACTLKKDLGFFFFISFNYVSVYVCVSA